MQMRMYVWLSALTLLGGCVAELDSPDIHGGEVGEDELGQSVDGLSLSGLGRGCSTAGTEGLSAQLLDEMQCLSDGALVPVSHPNVIATHSRVHLYLSPQGRDALLSVAASRQVRINSALRTIAEQYVLGRGCSVAAAPGRSNHETGRAIDVQNYSSVNSALQNAGFGRPLPSRDPVHYVAPGSDLRNLSVLAFQTLWNANNPGDRIAEDGIAGGQTTTRLARSPAGGFAVSGVCRGGTPPPADPPPADPPPADPPPADPPPADPPPSAGGSCTHSFGGTYADTACSAAWQCCDGRWSSRGVCGSCACVETSGETGCGAAPPPPPPSGASCTHTFGGSYQDRACSAGWQCCDGDWRERGATGCGTCECVETSGRSGC